MDLHAPCLDPNCVECNAALPKKFAHLHQHTQYSLLDGAAKIKDLLTWVKQVTPHDPACAITDHGNMHGAVTFYNYATELGVKPILGFEAYVAAGSRHERKRGEDNERGVFHLTMLAKNFEGYQNLCRLSSLAYLEGYYYKPRIDHELLERYHKGIVVFSGCLGAEVPQLILNDRLEEGKKRLEWYLGIFKENYYIEIQNHGLPEQQKVNAVLKAWANELGIGMAATNDGHYVQKDDARAHETLLAIQTKATLADEKRFKFPCDEFYVKSLEEMQTALPVLEWGDEIFSNTAEIARVCTVDLPVGKRRVYQMPQLPIPEGRTMSEELRIQSYAGIQKRYAPFTTPEFWRSYALASSAYLDSPLPLKAYYWAKYQAKMEQDPAGFPLERFEKIDFVGQVGELKLRIAGFDPTTDDLERVFTLVAFIGSLWESLGKAAGEKYTLYPALELLEAGEHDPHHQHALTVLRRTEYELSVINNMGFPDYFLIVADYINWAKDQGISVGPGRGSGAGSIVAYAVRITNLEPLEFGLLFERFLNPDRISMPDFDIDFSDSRRDEVIQYVRRKYGDEKVAQIATFGSLSSRAVLKDVARVMGLHHKEADLVSKMIPVKFGKAYSLEDAKDAVPDIQAALKENGPLNDAYTFAQKLEGLTRHASVHAAGVVIGRSELMDLVPLMKDNKDSGSGMNICQYDMKAVEDIGLIKMDFLGLRTLSFLEEASRILKESRDLEIDFDAIPFDDEKTFELLSRGDNKGVFQLEGTGIADASRRLKPKRLADIIALSALYRPGPMENIPTYIRRHHGLEEVNYVKDGFPNSAKWLEKILQETYGIPVYQEQIMQIASDVAGYSLGGADLLRRAMSKKDAKEMIKQRELFISGSFDNNVPNDEANKLFDMLESFANYGFNKCLVGHTQVFSSDGTAHTLLELFENQNRITLPSIEEGFTFAHSRVTGVFQNGIKPVFRLTTSLGKTLEATGNHPLLTLRGWKNLEDLQAGDRIAAPARLPVAGTHTWPQHELVMLGWILSEGNTCHPCGAYVYTNNPIMLEDICAAATGFVDTQAVAKLRTDRNNVYDIYLGTGKRGNPGRSGVRLWLERLDLVHKNALQKEIPREVFTLSNANLAVILGRYWSGDGFVFGTGSNTTPYLATSSSGMARQLQHLLLRLGIVTRLTQKHFAYKEGRIGYTLHVIGRRSFQAFLEGVAPHIVGKDEQLVALRSRFENTPAGRESVDVLPPEIKIWVAEAKETSGLTWTQLEQQSGVCVKEFYGAAKPHKKGFRRDTIHRLAQFLDNTKLEQACSEDIFWETIISIEPLEPAMTYDLEVENTHNFVANDLIVHNSHSAAYGVISYQTAWLKSNYPVEFMAALLTVERKDSDKVSEYISDARKMEVEVLAPDINYSGADFKVVGRKIYFGLFAIKNLGENAVRKILEERQYKGLFKSLADFCSRLDKKLVNTRGLEHLIKAGAFDAFGERAQLLDGLEAAMQYGAGKSSMVGSGMDTLFGMAEVAPEPQLKTSIAVMPELEKLKLEKDALGLYISGHPLEQYEGVRETANCKIIDLENWFEAQPKGTGRIKVLLAGMVSGVQKKPTKSGGMMARFLLSDETGSLELVSFSKAYERMQDKLEEDIPALVVCELDNQEGSLRVIAEALVRVEDLEEIPKMAYLTVDTSSQDLESYRDLRSALDEYSGGLRLLLRLEHQDFFEVWEPSQMSISREGLRQLEGVFPWVKTSLAFDTSSILGKFAPKPRWTPKPGAKALEA
jgi:DNA polymerase III subunit alpha